MQISSGTFRLLRQPHRTAKAGTAKAGTAKAGAAKTCVAGLLIAASLFAGVAGAPLAAAQDTKPYDRQLLRLSEILGAIHYLRELCGAKDDQTWRQAMQELIKAEGSSSLRRLKLTKKFNLGYRSYSRTYNNCTPSAKTAITRFINEGAVISDTMARNIP